jgi:hypothetical protein
MYKYIKYYINYYYIMYVFKQFKTIRSFKYCYENLIAHQIIYHHWIRHW